jgi:hypothetical protein
MRSRFAKIQHKVLSYLKLKKSMSKTFPGYGAVPDLYDPYANVYVSTGSGGSGGSTYTWAGTNGTTYDTSVLTVSAGSQPSLKVSGDAEISGTLKWRNRDMDQWIESVESRLAMLQPNPKLEEEFNKLKELGDQYRALEREILEKQKVWDILKKS